MQKCIEKYEVMHKCGHKEIHGSIGILTDIEKFIVSSQENENCSNCKIEEN